MCIVETLHPPGLISLALIRAPLYTWIYTLSFLINMLPLALPRRDKEARSGNASPASEVPPPAQNGKASPDLAQLEVAALDAERQKPKRSASFGRSLGGLASLTSGMAKTGDAFNRAKSGTSTPQSPALPSPGEQPSTPSAISAPKAGVSLMGPPSAPDASHLTQFSLKLSDLVNKAFSPCAATATPTTSNGSVASNVAAAAKGATSLTAGFATAPKIGQITYEGKHLPDKAKVIEIAQVVVSELRYAEAVDAYLLRAVSRQILKALTLFAARIDSLLVSPTKDPSALKVPINAKEGIHLPAALEYNLGLVTLEWIVEDSLERCIEGDRDAQGQLIADDNDNVHDGMPHFVSEILTPVRKKMEGTILHIIQPLLAQVKTSIARCISTAVPSPFVSTMNLSPTSTHGTGPTGDAGSISPSVPGNTSPPQRAMEGAPSLTAGASSTWLRELDGRLEGARRLLLPRIEERCGQDGEGWFISVAIHIIWKGLLILTSRSVALPINALTEGSVNNAASLSAFDRLMGEVGQKRSPSPAQLAQALKSVSVGSVRSKNRDLTEDFSDSGRETPLLSRSTGVSSIAPISMVSNRLCALQLAELQTFEKLMLRFCEGFLRKPDGQQKRGGKTGKKSRFALFASSSTALGGTQPTDLSAYDPDEEDELARAALAEAMHALKSTIIVLQAMEREPAAICSGLEQLKTLPGGPDRQTSASPASLGTEAAQALDAIPNLLLLQTLYNRLPLGHGRLELPSPPALFSYTWADYEKAISGFAGGDQWAQAAALRYKTEIEKAWRGVSMRKAEKLAALEPQHASDRSGGVGLFPQRAVSASSRLGSVLAQSSSLSSDDDSFNRSEEEIDTDAMSHSVPVLQKPKDSVSDASRSAMASDTNLASSAQVDSNVRSPTESSRGRPSPDRVPRRSVTVVDTDSTTAPAAPPRFWRRSSSNVRSGFHLSFSGLRSHSSPRTTPSHELTAEPACMSPAATSTSTVVDPMATQTRVADSAPSSTSLGNHLTTAPVQTVESIPASARELSDKDRILFEASLEQKALCMFAKAIIYAGLGQVHLDLR